MQRLFIEIWKPIWPPGNHIEFLASKCVTAISQQLLEGSFWNLVYRLPLGPSCATSLFIQIWKPIWPGGHLEFWTSKFVTSISQELLEGSFWNCVCWFPLGPSYATSLFIQIWKPVWPPGGHLEFWTTNVKVFSLFLIVQNTASWEHKKFKGIVFTETSLIDLPTLFQHRTVQRWAPRSIMDLL